jgi:hypothetical protein
MGAGRDAPDAGTATPARPAEGPAGGVAELAEHLVGVVGVRLLDPLEILLGDEAATGGLRGRVRARAGGWAARLLGGDERVAAETAGRLIGALYPGDGPFDPPAAWWRTPLGQAVLRRVGHPGAEAVSYAVAAAMLGMTRQGVHDLAARGKLDRHPDGGVTTASIRARIDRRSRPLGRPVGDPEPGRRARP